MSGGFFDYQQYRLEQMADDIDQLIRDNHSTETNQWGDQRGRGYTAETIAEFREAVAHLHKAQIYVQRIDWLVSGDDGEDSFHQRLAQDMQRLNHNG